MESTGVVYRITRHAVGDLEEPTIDRVEIQAAEDGYIKRDHVGAEARLAVTDLIRLIEADPDLHEVRANQIVSIDADAELAAELPLLLTVPGDVSDDTEWSPAVEEKHLAPSTMYQDMYRVAYVNGARWYAYTCGDGLIMLPENTEIAFDNEPAMSVVLGELSFSEEGGMTSGGDRSKLGLVTASVCAVFTHLDSYEDSLTVKGLGDVAEAYTKWLIDGDIASHYGYGQDDDGAAMLVQLVVETIQTEERSLAMRGDALAAGIVNGSGLMGSSPTGWWTMSIGVDADTTTQILDRLASLNDRLAEVVAASRDPQSPIALARNQALSEIHASET